MCIGCAITAASAATGFRSWLQNHRFGWLTPRRLRALTIAAMCAAGLASTIGFSGSTPPSAHAGQAAAANHRALSPAASP
jgi:hypothetical protein